MELWRCSRSINLPCRSFWRNLCCNLVVGRKNLIQICRVWSFWSKNSSIQRFKVHLLGKRHIYDTPKLQYAAQLLSKESYMSYAKRFLCRIWIHKSSAPENGSSDHPPTRTEVLVPALEEPWETRAVAAGQHAFRLVETYEAAESKGVALKMGHTLVYSPKIAIKISCLKGKQHDHVNWKYDEHHFKLGVTYFQTPQISYSGILLLTSRFGVQPTKGQPHLCSNFDTERQRWTINCCQPVYLFQGNMPRRRWWMVCCSLALWSLPTWLTAGSTRRPRLGVDVQCWRVRSRSGVQWSFQWSLVHMHCEFIMNSLGINTIWRMAWNSILFPPAWWPPVWTREHHHENPSRPMMCTWTSPSEKRQSLKIIQNRLLENRLTETLGWTSHCSRLNPIWWHLHVTVSLSTPKKGPFPPHPKDHQDVAFSLGFGRTTSTLGPRMQLEDEIMSHVVPMSSHVYLDTGLISNHYLEASYFHMSFLAANLSHWTLADTRTMQRQVVEKDMKRLSLSHRKHFGYLDISRFSDPPKIRPVFRGKKRSTTTSSTEQG